MKSVVFAAVAASSLVASTALAASSWQVEWSAPQAISTPAVPGAGPQNGAVATSQDAAEAVAVWSQYQGDAKYQVWTANTNDGGSTWSAPVALSEPGFNAEFPDVTISEDGNRATALWYVSAPGGDALQSASSDDGGDTWTPGPIDTGFSAGENPGVAGSADGNRLVAIWADFRTDLVLRVAKSSTAGSTWSTPVDLSDPDFRADDPTIEVSADGLSAVAAYTQDDVANSRVLVRTSTDGAVN